MFERPLPLFALAAACSSLAAVIIVALVARSIEIVNADQITQQIGETNATLAAELRNDAEREVGLVRRELRDIAQTATLSDLADHSRIDARLARLAADQPGLVWLGLQRRDGRVVTQIGSRDSAARVAWQTDLNAPIADDQGATIGVVSVVVGRQWIERVLGSLLTGARSDNYLAVLAAAPDGAIISSNSSFGATVGARLPQAAFGGNDYAVLDNRPGHPEDHKLIVGWSPGHIAQSQAQLGLSLYVAQDLEEALAPSVGIHSRIVIVTIILALHAVALALYMARAVSAPLARLANAAAGLTAGKAGSAIPLITAFSEVDVLSRSLISLVDDLKAREEAQTRLAESLELQVIERTDELARRNVSLEAANRLAAEATMAKTRFLAAASHDLRQPLHALSLFTGALRKRVSGPEAQQLVEQMRQSVVQLKRMFDALLHISRLDAGAIRADMTAVNVRQLIENMAPGFAVEARQRGLDFRSRSVPVTACTDATLLETILRNLVANAMKFTARGGVLIAARQRGGRIAIEVYDTGVGVEEHRLEGIFHEFERAADGATGPNDGLGLGLSIVRRYAGLIGAEIEVRTQPGVGSCFRILIPNVNSVSKSALRDETRRFELRGKRILLLDDNLVGLAALVRDLEDNGAMVSGHATPQSAEWALAHGLEFDLAVVDYELGPDSNGLDFLHRTLLSADSPHPALIITGRTDPSTLSKLEASGVAWLLKPTDTDAIAARFSQMSN